MKNIIASIILFAVSSAFFSCDAPRLNPLDPFNQESRLGKIDGFVFTSAREPVAGAKVVWENQNLLTVTDSTGYYVFESVLRNDGKIYFEKEGLGKDSLIINWNNRKSIRIEDRLLSFTIGQLDGFAFTSPRDPVAGIRVIWKNQNLITETNSSGYYKFDNVSINDGIIIFEKDGLKKDSVYVQWNNQKNVRADEKILSYDVARLFGYVKTVSVPRVPLANVKVFWKHQKILLETDASGYYLFNNISQSNGYLYFEKNGYSRDSVYVEFDGRKEKQVDEMNLNANPQIDDLAIYTIVLNRYPDLQITRMVVETSISDAENDVDIVYVTCEEINFSKILQYNPATRLFEGRYLWTELNLISVDEAIGKDFKIVVQDKNGKLFTVGSSNIKRIIKQEVMPESPINRQVVSSKPTLRWTRFQPGFNFRYTVQILTDEVSPVLIWQKENVSKDDIEIIPDITIPPGEYYWLISCIDDFKNSSTSKPASFIVQ